MARPIMSGTHVRQITMRHTSPEKNTDYRITITVVSNGYRVYTEDGPHGNLQNFKEVTKRPVSYQRAYSIAKTVCRSKNSQADSYVVIRDWKAIKPPHPTPKTLFPHSRLTLDALSPANRAMLLLLF